MELPKPKQWEVLSWVPIIAGLYWLLADDGGGWLLWALVPGSVLLATGIALLFMPGDLRIYALMATAAVIGIVFTLPVWVVADLGTAVFTLLGSAASFLVAGRVALTREPSYLGATSPELSTVMDAKAGLDEAVLGYFVIGARVPSGDKAGRMCDEALKMEDALRARGYFDDPARFHPAPPVPDETYVSKARIFGHDYEVLRFDSDYLPDPELPGAALWKTHARNQECHVRVMRHPGKPRPWLLCVHGYRMGAAWMDFGLFSPGWLHQRMGVNLIQPVLPLHGPRSIGLRSGDHFLDGDLLDLVYAQAQSLWDLRRCIAWLRANEESPQIGVLGYSLGGYNTALLANYEDGLDFGIAGIPVVDLAQALWRFMPPGHLRYLAARGLDEARYRSILSVISPLTQTPLLTPEKRYIFAATGDRIVVPEHPLRLAQHWNTPVNWYQGSHLSVRHERDTRGVIKLAMARAGWSVS
jgi:hypothetical protein